MTSFFRFVNKRASYPFGIILLAYMRRWMWLTFPLAAQIVGDIFRKRKYKLPSSNESILPYLHS